MSFWESVLLEGIKTLFAASLLLLTWFLGQRIITYWDLRKKRQEIDLQISTQFQELYGEFKEVTKLWRVFFKKTYDDEDSKNKYKDLLFPEDLRWELLERAVAAENRLDAILVKLATERELSEGDLTTLGIFRQAYQTTRLSIRNNSDADFGAFKKVEYHAFNDLASSVALIVSSYKRPKHLDPERAQERAQANFRKIIAIRGKGLKEYVEAYRAEQAKQGNVVS
jgi:hypothetical protein